MFTYLGILKRVWLNREMVREDESERDREQKPTRDKNFQMQITNSLETDTLIMLFGAVGARKCVCVRVFTESKNLRMEKEAFVYLFCS